jgi:phytoene desaturase
MSKKVLIIGTGMGGLATALRLTSAGYTVEMVEKHHQAGGRLNQIKDKGFTFDVGPSFFSMSYEFEEFFKSIGEVNPLVFQKINPLYAVFFAHRDKPFKIYTELEKLAKEFEEIEPNFVAKATKYLAQAKHLFHDTEYRIVKRNFDSKLDYGIALAGVPLRNAPFLFRSMWNELGRHFESQDVKVIFSLVAFFLGATPFDTPAVYALLNYTELEHDGYWNVKGGMYRIVEELVKIAEARGVKIHYNTEIVKMRATNDTIDGFIDQNGTVHTADVYVCNGDAAAFRGKILHRKKYTEEKLDAMDWTLAPFTMYLGVQGTIPGLHHHSYFLGSNFNEYASDIFKTSIAPEAPYYYVNVSSKSNPECAPEGCENLFILCPVPDQRYKPDWSDAGLLGDRIIADLSKRCGYDIAANIITKTVLTPIEWGNMFNLYKGSGLGLAHGLNQIGGLRPANQDELFGNLYYVGASTVPGTGLPITVISSRLVTERITHAHPA